MVNWVSSTGVSRRIGMIIASPASMEVTALCPLPSIEIAASFTSIEMGNSRASSTL